MTKRILHFLVERRNRRSMKAVRRTFERFGYPLHDVTDSQLKAELKSRGREIDASSLSAKPVLLAARRLGRLE